jgi:ribonuclease D
VSDTLRGFGARNWQVGLLAVQLAEVLPDPVG